MSYRDVDGNECDGNGRALGEPPEMMARCISTAFLNSLPSNYQHSVHILSTDVAAGFCKIYLSVEMNDLINRWVAL